MDVETAGAAAEGSSRFRRWLAALVGVAAILVALLTTLYGDLSIRQEQAELLSARLAASAVEVIGVRGVLVSLTGAREVDGGELGGTQRIMVDDLHAQGVGRAATGTGPPATGAEPHADRDWAVGNADQAAAARIAEIHLVPTGEQTEALDPHTASLLTATDDDIDSLIAEQNHQVALAKGYGARGDRAFLGLSLLAVGAVFLGLSGLLGEGRGGFASLWGAGLAVVVSSLLAASALLGG